MRTEEQFQEMKYLLHREIVDLEETVKDIEFEGFDEFEAHLNRAKVDLEDTRDVTDAIEEIEQAISLLEPRLDREV